MKTLFLLSSALTLICSSPAAASGFLGSQPGARAAAMGGAFTGLADDASAMFYNPAGLAGQRGALMFEHVPIAESGVGLTLNDGRVDTLMLVYPTRLGSFGFGVNQFEIGGIETRSTLADNATVVNTYQTAYYLPYAVNIHGWALGVTGKAVNYSLAGFNGTGLGADLGLRRAIALGDTFLGRDTEFAVGAAVLNALQPTFTLYQDPTALERTMSGGLSFSAFVREHYEAATDKVSHDRMSLDLDAGKGNQDTPLSVAVGMDYAYLDRYAVRVGFNANGNFSMGLGYGGKDSTFRVDYAAVMAPLAPQHRFTISWLFTSKKDSVESEVHLSGYRRAVLDQERLRDRFLHDGRSEAAEGHYDAAYTAFRKAQVLDPHNREIDSLVESSKEGSRLAGVKELLDTARRERTAGHDELAAKAALQAVQFDPTSREASDYAVKLRNDMIAEHGPGTFDQTRADLAATIGSEFQTAASAKNPPAMGQALARVKAVDPDDIGAWQPLQEEQAAALKSWHTEYTVAASSAEAAGDPIAMSRAIRRLRRVAPADPKIAELNKHLTPLSRKSGDSFYDKNYLQQLYYASAASYVVGDIDGAIQNLTVLLRANALHEAANALIDRMREEGVLSEDREP